MLSSTFVAHATLTTEAQVVSSDETARVDWTGLLASDKPAGLSSTSWATVVADIASQLGATEGSYATSLLAVVRDAAGNGVTFVSEAQALDYVVQRALATGAGASVSGTLFLGDDKTPLEGTSLSLESVGAPGLGTLLTASSWYDGRFNFWDVPPGIYDLTVDGHLPHVAARVDAAPAADGLSVVVTDGASLSGAVTSATSGAPIDGASVTVGDGSGKLAGASGADGTYTVSGIDSGPATVSASAAGYLPSPPETLAIDGTSGQSIDFALSTGGTISGTVLTAGGAAPPAGTTVSAVPADSAGAPASATVSADGTYSISGLEPEPGPDPHTYTVTAVSPAGVGSVTGVTVTGTSTTSGVTITLSPGASVSGTVTDSDTGLPLPGISVASLAAGSPDTTVTDASGNYTLAGIPPEAQQLSFTASDAGHVPSEVTIDPTEGQAVRQDIALAPTGSMTATLSTTAGVPLPYEPLVLVGPFPSTSAPGATYAQAVSTDGSGAAAASALLPGTYDVQVPGSPIHASFTIGTGQRHADVALSVPVAVVSGTVTTSAGNPLAGVAVDLVDATGYAASTTTAADGTYSLFVTSAGTFDLTASGSAFGAAVATGVTLAPGSGATVDWRSGTTSLSVTATEGGVPAPGATVALSAGSGAAATPPLLVQTGADGSATIAPLAPGTYTVSVQAPGEATTVRPVTVTAGENNLSVPLSPGATIAGTVSGPSGPMAGATVRASGPVTEIAGTAADGSYSLVGLLPGTYDLSFSGTGAVPQITEGVAVPAGGFVSVDSALPSSGDTVPLAEQPAPGGALPPLSVVVIDANGSPVEEASLGPALGTSSSTAAASIGPLAPGSYTLAVSGEGTATSTEALTVPSGLVEVTPPPAEALLGPVATATSLAGGPSHRRDPRAPIPPERPAAGIRPAAAAAAAPAAAGSAPSFSWSDLLDSWMASTAPVPQQVGDPAALAARVAADTDLSRVPACASLLSRAYIQSLMIRADRLYTAEQSSYDAWREAYKAFYATQRADLALVATDVAITAGDLAGAYLSIASPAGELESWATGAGLSSLAGQGEQLSAALTTITGGAYAYSSLESELLSASPADAANSVSGELNNWGNLQATLAAIKLPGIGSQMLGVVGGLEQAVSQIESLLSDLQSLLTDASNILNTVVQSQDTYLAALRKLWDLLADIELAFAHLQMQDNCPPPPPPSTPPPPPGPQNHFDNHVPGDPNGIHGTPGAGSANWLAGSPPPELDYRVQFQNEPTANAAAVLVKITEPVPASVDPASVQLTGFGFGRSTTYEAAPGVPAFATAVASGDPQGDLVDVAGSFDQASSTITWTFSTIDPSTGDLDYNASAGFLPPDDAQGDGEGYVTFSARPRPGLAQGAQIHASASIVFDRNPAISTPVWSNSIDSTVPSATVSPLPAVSAPGRLLVSWKGSDPNGPGIVAYDVYVSVDGGPLRLWWSHVPTTEAYYDLATGHRYGFAAQAVDVVGLEGPRPAAAQATTTAGTSAQGYFLASADGHVAAAGGAIYRGELAAPTTDPVVSIASTPSGNGYWEATRDGTVAPFGDAKYFGDLPGLHLSVGDVVALAPTADGRGYWLIGADGGTFSFGDARYHGSLPGLGVHVSDVVGMAATPDGAGYVLVGRDGGVFVFGGRYHGSLPGLGVRVDDIVGILPTGRTESGYVLVGADGGAFVFGSGSGYYGSLPGRGVHVKDVVGIALTNDQRGYWMAEADGRVEPFGDARSFPEPAGVAANRPVAGISGF